MEEIRPRNEPQDKNNYNGVERSEKIPAQSYTAATRREHRYKNMMHLWEFLLELLADESCKAIICWKRKDHGEFKLLNQNEVAKRWGILKRKEGMNYGKLSRALRMYYREGIITKVKGARLVYKFNNLPYKYEPGITRSFYRERFQTINTGLREQEQKTFKPLLRIPAISSVFPPGTSPFPSITPPLRKRSSWPVVPMPSPQVCWCSGPVPCVSLMCCSKSRIFFPVSSLSASRGFKPDEPAFSAEYARLQQYTAVYANPGSCSRSESSCLSY